MRKAAQWTIPAVLAALLAGCSTAPKPKLAQAPAPAELTSRLPYIWTLGNAPKAYKEMVAQFGKPGLTPGQYIWAAAIPSEGETRVIIDRLTQMAYV